MKDLEKAHERASAYITSPVTGARGTPQMQPRDSFYHYLYKYCFNYLFGICIYIFIIISTFDCIYFITTVFYGQPFICLIVLCM